MFSSGIIKHGTLVKCKCECGEEFSTYKGTITIKGPIPPEILCKKCREIEMEKSIESVVNFFTNKSIN